VEDLTDQLPAGAWQAAWDTAERRFLFILKAGVLQRLDRVLHRPALTLLNRVAGVQVVHNTPYVLSDDGSIQRLSSDGQRVIERFRGVPLERAGGLLQLDVLPGGDVVLLGKRGELFSSRSVQPLVERGVRGLDGLPKQDRVLFWTKDRLGMLEPEGTVEQERALHPLRVQWIFTQGHDLAQGFWVYEGSHCLVRDGDRVLLFALETYGQPHQDELLQVKAGSSIAYTESSGMLYYLDRETGQLRALELLPKQDRLPLPEWTGQRKRKELEPL